MQNGKCTNFANDSGKQTIRYFRVVPDDQNWSVSCENIVSILFLAFANGMNVGFQSFGWADTDLQSYVCGFEQVKLYVSSNIPLSP